MFWQTCTVSVINYLLVSIKSGLVFDMGPSFIFVLIICVFLHSVNSRLTLEDGHRMTFDQDLYEDVLDSSLCTRQMLHMFLNDQLLFMQCK